MYVLQIARYWDRHAARQNSKEGTALAPAPASYLSESTASSDPGEGNVTVVHVRHPPSFLFLFF
jgi:hypothetical protein